ncbi:hypothetical protein [Nocardiopsis alborubida]|uniref:Uncharacterized protein n=1 Tax=Nocardiopsis alborubida TaxID=146802 RepID=A0A7X6MC55_9ACTN|nr:hypothetical protein [Nocardiopsis alborubida]NKY97243.1 hypothetical protein [Nocardiopsis alborubida]
MGETGFDPRRTAAWRAAGAAAPAGTPPPARTPGAVPEHVRTDSRDAVVDAAARFTASSRSHRR